MVRQQSFDFPEEPKPPDHRTDTAGTGDAAGDQHLPVLWRAHAVVAAREHTCRRG